MDEMKSPASDPVNGKRDEMAHRAAKQPRQPPSALPRGTPPQHAVLSTHPPPPFDIVGPTSRLRRVRDAMRALEIGSSSGLDGLAAMNSPLGVFLSAGPGDSTAIAPAELMFNLR